LKGKVKKKVESESKKKVLSFLVPIFLTFSLKKNLKF